MKRVQLNRDGKRHLHEKLLKGGIPKCLYEEVKPIEARPCAVWLVESHLGEQRLFVTCPEMRMEQLVDILKVERWRKHFTVTMLDAGRFDLHPGGHYYSPDGRKVNEKGEVI